jgi:hypothetical protein
LVIEEDESELHQLGGLDIQKSVTPSSSLLLENHKNFIRWVYERTQDVRAGYRQVLWNNFLDVHPITCKLVAEVVTVCA